MKTMAINKFLYCLFFVLFTVYTVPMNGQRKAWEEMVEKNIKIEKEINILISDTVSLDKKLSTYKYELEKLNNNEKDIDLQIKGLVGSFDKQKLDSLRHSRDSLTNIEAYLKRRENELRQLITKNKEKQSSIKNKIDEMSNFSETMLKEQYQQNKELIKRRYSQITEADLKEISATINNYKENADFEDYKKRVKDAVFNKDIFERATNALQCPYNGNVIAKIREEIVSKLEIQKDNIKFGRYKLSDNQYSEMDSLNMKLSRYKNGVNELKAIVGKVNNDLEIKGYRDRKSNKTKCIERICEIVLSQEEDSVKIRHRYFEMIPYLSKLLNDYWEELRNDPFTTPNEAEKEIDKLGN